MPRTGKIRAASLTVLLVAGLIAYAAAVILAMPGGS